MNWSIIDLKVGDYIKCQTASEREEFIDFLATYGYIAQYENNLFNYDGYWLKVVARWFDTKNFK